MMNDEATKNEGANCALSQTQTVDNAHGVKRLAYRFVKRFFDIAFSSVVLAVGLIPGSVLAAAITLEGPGGPLFTQDRIGKDGKTIHIYKFRSMHSDAHEHPEKYLDDAQLAQWTREQKVDDDPRITPIGKFIRKTSLDEFPQFLNVLIGDMSVIGPRPVPLEETYEFGDNRDEALSIRPGITGWWQVTDRNDATWENGRRQELELEYVRNQTLAMDMRVFFRTFGAMANETGR